MTNGQPIRVLQAVPSMGHGGIEHFLMNLYRAIDKDKVQFDFMYRVSYECVFDKEIDAMGGRIFRCVDPDRHPVRSGRFYRSFFAEHPEFCAVHEHRSGCDGFFGLMRAAKHAGVPIRILHSHNSQKGWAYNPVKDLTDAFNAPRLAAFANTFVACSDVAATYLARLFSIPRREPMYASAMGSITTPWSSAMSGASSPRRIRCFSWKWCLGSVPMEYEPKRSSWAMALFATKFRARPTLWAFLSTCTSLAYRKTLPHTTPRWTCFVCRRSSRGCPFRAWRHKRAGFPWSFPQISATWQISAGTPLSSI